MSLVLVLLGALRASLRTRTDLALENLMFIPPPARRHWLWVFTSPKGTLFRVDSRRRASIVTQVLGRKFTGILSRYCLNVYDSLNCAQQKCYAHHLQAIREAEDNASSTANTQVLKDLRILLLKAIAVGKMRNDIALPSSKESSWRLRNGRTNSSSRPLRIRLRTRLGNASCVSGTICSLF